MTTTPGLGFMTSAFLAGAATAGVRRARELGQSPAQGAADAMANAVADTVWNQIRFAGMVVILFGVAWPLSELGVPSTPLTILSVGAVYYARKDDRILIGALAVLAAVFFVVTTIGIATNN